MVEVGLIGLGLMGYGIGAQLARSGLLKVVYNRSTQKAERFSSEFGVQHVRDPAEAARRADTLITMLADDEAVSSVVGALLPELKGKTLIDMSTVSPSLSVRLAESVSKHGGTMLDAPVVGTYIMLERREVAVLVGGRQEDFVRVKPILETFSKSVVHVGKNGMGLYAKIVANLLLGAYIASLAEAYSFGLKAGLDKTILQRLFTELSSVRSPASQLKAPKMLAADYTTQFALKHMRKDLEIVQREAQRLRAFTPISALTTELYRGCEMLGYSEHDFAAVAEIYKALSGQASQWRAPQPHGQG